MIPLLVILALARGVVYAAAIPPWQSPDEHGHYEYAWLVSQHGPFVGRESISPEFQQRVLASMYQFDYWRFAHQRQPEKLPTTFTDPGDRWLVHSAPQVGDERPLYYLMVGSLLRIGGVQNVLVGMYVGRIVSVFLYAAAVGVTALITRRVFSPSRFMQIAPPAFILFLPMGGEMGASVSNDALGILTGALFFASLAPIFRDGLTWRRGAGVVLTLALSLLSKKISLFLAPTAGLALLAYGWTRGIRVPRRVGLTLIGIAVLLALIATALALIPGRDAAGWMEQASGCGPTRLEGEAVDGEAALRVGPCAAGVLAPAALPAEPAQVTLSGWVRSTKGQMTGHVAILDTETSSRQEVAADETWRPFTLTHTVSQSARWAAVRLDAQETGGALLFDGLKLSAGEQENLLANGSAEEQENLLFDLVSDAAFRVGAPRRLVERMASPQSWGLTAWGRYADGALFCFHSFWGLFGSQALPLPPQAYWGAEWGCILALLGNLLSLVRQRHREWQVGYLLMLKIGVVLLALQTLAPMIGMRETYWLPQGRYLFPGLFAIGILLAWGFHSLLPRRWERWTTPLAVGVMASFDLTCLGFLITPYFFT